MDGANEETNQIFRQQLQKGGREKKNIGSWRRVTDEKGENVSGRILYNM